MLALAAALATPRSGRAQVEAEPILNGQVLLGDTVLGQGTVTLHLLSEDQESAIDSVTLGPDGRFRLRLPHVPDPERSEVFFATLEHHDIVYVGDFITLPIQLDTVYTIQAYDTTAAPRDGADLTLQIRNLFLEAEAGAWRVTDVFQIHHDGPATLVVQDGGVVWRYPLPDVATSIELGQSDIVPGGTVIEDGHLVVRSPIPPGDKLFVVQYVLPSPFLSAPAPGRTQQVDLLIREPAPELVAPGLTRGQAIEFEPGSAYRRYTASDWDGSDIRLREGEPRGAPPVRGMAVALALILTAAGLWTVVGKPPAERITVPATPSSGGRSREAIIMEIARLDEAFAAMIDPDEGERAAYERQRRALLSRVP